MTDEVKRMPNESAEMYHIKRLAQTDIKMVDAKAKFNREPYYKKFLKSSNEDLGYNPHQE